jgi:hypothetical protein
MTNTNAFLDLLAAGESYGEVTNPDSLPVAFKGV